MLEKEFEYYTQNHSKLFSLYPNKYLVIKEKKVLFSTDTMQSALELSREQGLEPGTFLIQKCEEGAESFTQVYHSRVTFA